MMKFSVLATFAFLLGLSSQLHAQSDAVGVAPVVGSSPAPVFEGVQRCDNEEAWNKQKTLPAVQKCETYKMLGEGYLTHPNRYDLIVDFFEKRIKSLSVYEVHLILEVIKEPYGPLIPMYWEQYAKLHNLDLNKIRASLNSKDKGT